MSLYVESDGRHRMSIWTNFLRWVMVIESGALGGATAWWAWQALQAGNALAFFGLLVVTMVWFVAGLWIFENYGRRGRHQ